MRKSLILIPLAAAAALAGCASDDYRATPGPVTSASGAPVVSSAPVVSAGASPTARTPVVVPAAAIRPGTGTIETVSAVPFLGSASTGASAPGTASRLGIRMSDGTMQYVDYVDRDLTVGTRVELTSDGFIKRI
jgi:hypothetical protein